MSILNSLKPCRVFSYFEELSAIPRGSGNMNSIVNYCMDFAKNHNLEAVRDDADNVIIYKNGSAGYENSPSIILQGHLDMVCQKKDNCDIDFLRDGITLSIEGDFVTANGTTLGADNGIAVAMILAILESDSIKHPPIEAVFTTDEEIGLIGATAIDESLLSSKRMINLDAEEADTLTVSCAGGSNFTMNIPITKASKLGVEATVNLSGLLSGHSGIDINKGRINAVILAGRFLNHLNTNIDLEIIGLNSGEKVNVIPNSCEMRFCVKNFEDFKRISENYLSIVKKEISFREPDFTYSITEGKKSTYTVFEESLKNRIIYILLCAPNGIMQMSAEIKNLVETSLNLGILKTEEEEIIIQFNLRSNKKSALLFLEDKLRTFATAINCTVTASGHYPPWEYENRSELREIYIKSFKEQFGFAPKVEALHAGLECGVFASKIEGLDCIAMGPSLFDVHTPNERLKISSAQQIFNLLLKILEKSK